MKLMLVATAGILSLVASAASAQQGPPQFPDMTFFVTSKGLGNGGNLGGLEGADKHCQALATAAGAGARTWHAYLSTQADGGKPAVNARDRIGKGPWKNAKGEVIATSVDDLHSPNNKLTIETDLTETGRKVPGFGFSDRTARHAYRLDIRRPRAAGRERSYLWQLDQKQRGSCDGRP